MFNTRAYQVEAFRNLVIACLVDPSFLVNPSCLVDHKVGPFLAACLDACLAVHKVVAALACLERRSDLAVHILGSSGSLVLEDHRRIQPPPRRLRL